MSLSPRSVTATLPGALTLDSDCHGGCCFWAPRTRTPEDGTAVVMPAVRLPNHTNGEFPVGSGGTQCGAISVEGDLGQWPASPGLAAQNQRVPFKDGSGRALEDQPVCGPEQELSHPLSAWQPSMQPTVDPQLSEDQGALTPTTSLRPGTEGTWVCGLRRWKENCHWWLVFCSTFPQGRG